MNIARPHVIALALAGCAFLLTTPGAADETGKETIRFAPAKRIKAGNAFLGAGRLYPSPVLHDVNGDGRPDVVVGDLFGRITVAHRGADGALAAEQPVNDRDGRPLKFHNW